ncbi:bifunctional metallophosphatase/5'-nucleotidase [Lottiidibacillus patelloidae]|uniref:Bifunctional metallophosphatase/5'-nucleotidase n=1 Tax=Lottiidibacillus patelloidae TaxID=2670334 RepID=A0A263BQH9_9BACI|nr:bifunctional UDP-sugar hydrolase/5'-nucleotidase [Lottiidibacillus patelloidae]OZM55974.1 bifunctional metallophosphatase/5'-nucleotidase [Lottiidibacillus patelloidae]
MHKLHIFHTNDIHSQFNNWPKIAYVLKGKRSYFEENDEDVLVFDIGDFIDRSHPIAEATLGKDNVSLLNDAGYDAVTIGNNEGITLSKEALFTLYDDANFSVLLGNVKTSENMPLPNTTTYTIHTTKQNVKVAVIGLTAPYYLFYELLGMKVIDPINALTELLHELEDKADAFILLSHLGLDEDRKIAAQFPKIDLILGAHTHQLLETGERVNETLITQCGKHGSFVGHVTLTIDEKTKSIQQKKASVIDVTEYKVNKLANDLLQKLLEKSSKELNEPILQLNNDLSLDWYADNPFADLLAHALKDWCNGDIAMVNAGVLLEPLSKGVVSAADLHRICPHPINPCNVRLTGYELKEVIAQARTSRMENLEVKGLGFRGKVMGRMAFSGVDVKTEVLADGQSHITDILVEGEPIDYKRIYTLSTIDMFTFGRLYPEIRHAKHKKYFMPELLRDVLEWALKNVVDK